MINGPKDARLMMIAPHKELRGLRQKPLEYDDPCPLILDRTVPQGYYALHWHFMNTAGGPCFNFDLVKPEGKDVVVTTRLTLRAHEYFSHGTVSLRIASRSEDAPVLLSSIKTLFNGRVDQDPAQVACKFTDHQTQAFNARMRQWIAFPDNEEDMTLYTLKTKVAAYYQLYTQNRMLGAEVIKLPPGYDPV